MTKKIRQIWNAINNALTIINIFLLMILMVGGIDPKKAKKIPLVANIILLLVLGFVIYASVRSYGNRQDTINLSKGTIAVNMGGSLYNYS